MKTIYYTATSLDGFIADPQHSLDWLLQFGDVGEATYAEFIENIGTIVMGSHTYEWILRNFSVEDGALTHWPYSQPCWVFSSRELPLVAGADIRIVRGRPDDFYRDMQVVAKGKDIWVVGGGDLAGQFYDCNLLDQLVVQIAPVTLGSGAPLLPRVMKRPHLGLLSMRAMGEFFVELRYEVPKE